MAIQDITATDIGFAALGKCATLSHVWANGCDHITAKAVTALADLPHLASMTMGGSSMNDEALASLPKYKALKDMHPVHFGDRAYADVGKTASIESLTNMYCRETGDVATSYLKDMKNLKAYHIWGAQISDKSLEILAGMESLEDLLFYRCNNLTDAGLATLARLPRLEKLDLQENSGITEKGLEALNDNVQVNYQPPR